jgi:hypothetical protein
MEKLTYNNVVEYIGVIHFGKHGWEYIAEDTTQYTGTYPNIKEKIVKDFKSKRYNSSNDNYFLKEYGKEWLKNYKADIKVANKELSNWKKGVRYVIKVAKKGLSGVDKMANFYTGNGPKNEIEYFWRLYRSINKSDLIKIGESNGKIIPIFTGYVDGTYDYTLQ